MRAPVFALLTALLAVTAAAQSMEPTLLATDSVGRPTQMQLTRLEIDTRIVGALAETRMTMTFHNPDGSVHQGDLSFPVPDGATVSGYALDIAGVMVDGVVVEKERGRVVFEEIVRRGTDPGLVEWAGGNVFRTRVFPLPARGDRRIMVRFVSELEGGRLSST
jgi:Ca-activated chloride channel family protein